MNSYIQIPPRERIAAFLLVQATLPYSYDAAGATRGEFPGGFDHDRNSVRLGEGSAAFERACAALRRWEQFPAPWTKIEPGGVAIVAGIVVAPLIRVGDWWWLNAARVVYVIDEPRRFGFAYGTLPGHVECGEEFFCVEWRDDDSVWYRIEAFSRPRHWIARLFKPYARMQQRRFVRESQTAMIRAAKGC